ncbi:MAG: cation:proton antiporter [Desulfovibrionaceae bacterium]|nr:cation:proton antiporter [Desulfovibrionaceae bacterium]
MAATILTQILVIFLLAVLVNIVCTRFKLPVIVGFLLTGVLAGPSLLGLVHDIEFIEDVADLGVAMLMFTIGMELSGEVLHRLKRPVFLGGSLQIGLILAACAAVMAFFSDFTQGIFWGCLLALSSSAIVLQIFQQKGITATPVGRLSLAILVFQDMLVAPMMLLVPLLAGTMQITPLAVAVALGKVAAMAVVMYLFLKYALDRLLNAVVRTRSSELLLLTTLCMCLGFATITEALGMSFSLGAFLAGLMLARSRFAMSAVADIMPYRDVFLSLFFITVGMMLDVRFVAEHLLTILGCVAVYIVLKTLLTMPAVLVQGYPLRTAIRTSLCLSQVGEFSFVLAASGVSAGLMSSESHQFFLALSVVTMMLTPALIAAAPGFSKRVAGLLGQPVRAVEEKETASSDLQDHIIIVGFGFTGKQLAKAARNLHIRYTILEMNPETVSNFQSREPISYGDASQPVILEGQGVEHARVLAIAISDTMAVRAIVSNARKANPDLTIIARTRFVTEIEKLYGLGANRVVAEEFEAGIETFCQTLTAYLLPSQDVTRMAQQLRQNYYSSIRRRAHSSDIGAFVSRLPDLGVCAIKLDPGSPYAGKSLLEGNIRRRLGLTIVAVSRDKVLTTSPDGSFVLQPGDILYIFCKTDEVYTARERLNNGDGLKMTSRDVDDDEDGDTGVTVPASPAARAESAD